MDQHADHHVSQAGFPRNGEVQVLRLATLACAAGFLLIGFLVALQLTDPVENVWLAMVGEWRAPALTQVMAGFSWLGSGAFEFPFALAVVGILVWQGRARSGARYFTWALGGWALYAGLKLAFERPRPSVLEKLSGGGWWSFPSGHAMLGPVIFVFAVAMLTADPRWSRYRLPGLLLAWLLCLGIAVSRVYLGVHYPSDVVAGLLAGGAWTAFSLSCRPDVAGPAPAALRTPSPTISPF